MSTLLDDELLRVIEDHVTSDVDREVGGVLVGRMETDVVAITAVIPALAAIGGSANVTFTQEVWADVHRQIEEHHPGGQIVGWYHSHPGFGIFLSGYDRFIHENFFPAAGHLALVVDPLAGEAGWFGWRNGEIVEVERFPARAVEGQDARGQQQTARHPSRRGWRNVALLGMPIVAIAGFIAGQLVVGDANDSADEAVSAIRSVDESEDAERFRTLESELAAERGRSRQLEAALEVLEQKRLAHVPEAEGTGTETHIAYTVGSGDSLWKIAERVYGDGRAWPQLAAANPDIEPDHLIIGTRLRVPVPDERLLEPHVVGDETDQQTP